MPVGTIEYSDNTYGREIWTYCGEVADGRSHGRGVDVCKSVDPTIDGHRYEGDHYHDSWHGRGAFRSGDGTRHFDGAWANNLPQHGTALDGGVLYRVMFDGKTPITSGWAPSTERWERIGELVQGQPGPEFGQVALAADVAATAVSAARQSWPAQRPTRPPVCLPADAAPATGRGRRGGRRWRWTTGRGSKGRCAGCAWPRGCTSTPPAAAPRRRLLASGRWGSRQ